MQKAFPRNAGLLTGAMINEERERLLTFHARLSGAYCLSCGSTRSGRTSPRRDAIIFAFDGDHELCSLGIGYPVGGK